MRKNHLSIFSAGVLVIACERSAPAEPTVPSTAKTSSTASEVMKSTPEAKARALIDDSPFAEQAEVLAGSLGLHVSLKPSRSTMDAIPMGASRLAGQPDLPVGHAWPVHGDEPMALLAQINLADVAPHAPEGVLPPKGWLYFFWAVDSEGWGATAESADSFAVRFHDGPAEGLSRVGPPPGLPQWAQDFAPCSVAFEAGVALPGWQDLRYPKALDLGQNLEAWYELSIRVMGQEPPGGTTHHLLGHAQLVQRDPRGMAAKHRGGEAEDWSLLLQLETDEEGPNWMWGDVGTVYFMVRDEDRQARRFEEAWLVLQSH